MAKKKIKNLKTGAFGRGFTLAGLGVRAGAKVAGLAVGNIFSGEAAIALRKKAHLIEQAAMLARELGQLKGSLMKAGQMLSVYGEHFLPPEANLVLKTLQSDSAPVDWPEMEKVLARSLGKDTLGKLHVEPEALAAASMGQVHKATRKKGGPEFVLKIQYPGVDRAIDGDIKTLKRVLALTEWLPKLPATDELFLEIRAMLKHELDYERERKMLEFFREKLAGDPRYVLPEPIEEFSAKRVLAMSYEPGVPVDSDAVSRLSQTRRNALAKAALELYFRELFVWRKVQTDPHFGNYRVRIDGGRDRGKADRGRTDGDGPADQLVLLDFGAVREVPEGFAEKYRLMLRGLFRHSREEFEEAAARLGVLAESDPPELKDLFFELCSAVVEPFAQDEPYDWRENDLPKRVSKTTWEIFRRFPLRAPPREVVFLDRKMAGMFTFLSVLGAKISARETLAPYME